MSIDGVVNTDEHATTGGANTSDTPTVDTDAIVEAIKWGFNKYQESKNWLGTTQIANTDFSQWWSSILDKVR